MNNQSRSIRRCGLLWHLLVLLVAAPNTASAAEKIILLDDLPRNLEAFEVRADGSRVYFGHGSQFYVFDARGKLVDKYGAPTAARELLPLPTGWFIACLSHANGQLALYRPDGTLAQTLVARGDHTKLRGDMTGWTSPCGAAVDFENQRLFALDTTMAPRDDRKLPDPDWSRIAVFDLDGKYLGQINAYSAYAEDAQANDARRTWYDDIEVDPQRRRVYLTSRRTHKLLAFNYDGTPAGTAAGPGGPLAVFPDGRVAVGSGDTVRIYGPDLNETQAVRVESRGRRMHVRDLETDAAGQLYASVHDADVTFLRWSADLASVELFGPRYKRIRVEFPSTSATAGQPLQLRASAEGRPTPEKPDRWQVLARPGDGSDLTWQLLPSRYADGVLHVTPRGDLRGPYEIAVRFGADPISLGDRENELYLQTTVFFAPPSAERSVAVYTASGRRVFRQGESIPLQVVCRGREPAAVRIEVDLVSSGKVLQSAPVTVAENLAVEVPSAITRRLTPGEYQLRPRAESCETYALPVHIAPAEPDSPMQRILYHEFGDPPATARNRFLADAAEEMDYLRRYTEAVARLGFTRETDRLAGGLVDPNRPVAWRRDHAPADLGDPGHAPAEYYAIPHPGAQWQAEYYLDQAARCGIRYDTQLLGHCDGVRFRDWWLARLNPALQKAAQWLGRYPAFYGVNYNDEMFFGGWAQGWTQDDKDWLERTQQERFAGRPRPDMLRYALRVMYDSFNRAVRQANPRARITTTPMWQFPAVEGSYAPEIYRDMSESYSHFISEGYQYPWYPAHSAEFLRRPGLPLMGVFDNGYGTHGGDIYVKNLMQVVARGVQGTGVAHTRPFDDPWGASVYRTANRVARMYGPVFAEVPPANEAAVLYSYAQDITERRNSLGTPHFERVFELYGAGLMAGVPMQIVYEEDLEAGWLLQSGEPRVPMLFFVGQVERLPAAVEEALKGYVKAGGKLLGDADTHYPADVLPLTKLDLPTHRLKQLYHEGYAADTIHPLFQPVLEDLARKLRGAVAGNLRFAMQTDDPWISKNGFDGGAVRYAALAVETAPFPWDAGTVWGLGAMYCKTRHTYLPKVTTLTLPATTGVVYDVFEQKLVQPEVDGQFAKLRVDLRTFPGKLYALAPAPLGAPQIDASLDGDTLHYRVRVSDKNQQPLPAQVPLRLRLAGADAEALEIYRATGLDGVFTGCTVLPATADRWALEVTELLGGQGARVDLNAQPLAGEFLVRRPDVEVQRAEQILDLLRGAKGQGGLTLVTKDAEILTAGQQQALAAALKTRGVELKIAAEVPQQVTPGVYLAAGYMQGLQRQGDMLRKAWSKGLYDYDVTERVPGAGRGICTAVFAPRGHGEQCIVLLGGDREGLARAVQTFVDWLTGNKPSLVNAKEPATEPRYEIRGRAAAVRPLTPLRDLVGVKLSGVRPGADGRHLLVTAEGYWRNLALVEDTGDSAGVVRAVRAGQSPLTSSPYLSRNAKHFGAANRTVARFGEGFHLFDAATGKSQVFAAFGDVGRQLHTFAVSDDARVVIAPGSYGVVCWHRRGDAWAEAWAEDYWREFPELDWPVSDVAGRTPQFHAVIPRRADYALVLFGEFSNNGWVKPENFCRATLKALSLDDGSPRWTFEVPIAKTQLFPTLYTSPDGSRIMLQVQMGSWGSETYRYFSIRDGKARGSWDTKKGATPVDVALADSTGQLALVFKQRLLEMRRDDGTLRYNMLWPSQPLSVAFAADGESLLVADDAGTLSLLGPDGVRQWSLELGCVGYLGTRDGKVYVAGWDGRLRSYDESGGHRWTLDCTPALNPADPLAELAASADYNGTPIWSAARQPTTSAEVPAGENLLAGPAAELTVGGTRGWMSEGKVQVRAEDLTNGKTGDVDTAWLHLDELFWDAQAGRQVWAEIAFQRPTDVDSLTVYEHAGHGESWPTEGLVQVWNEDQKRWDTAAFGVFLRGAVNTYPLNLRGVQKIRYLPLSSYYRNFYTSEIEVRGRPQEQQ